MKKLTSARNKNTKFYIVGDFNANVLKIDKFHNISVLIDMMYTYNAVMLVNKPTRFPIGKQPGDPSLLDHFYTNDPLSIKEFGIVTNSISPDHFGLLAIIENTSSKRNGKTPDIFIRDYKKADVNALRESLSLFDPSYLNGLSIDNKFQLFQHHITNCIETHVPLRKLSLREKKFKDKPWISKDLQNNMAYRDQLAREVNVENKVHLKPLYNRFRKRLEKKLRCAKQDFFRKLLDEAKTKSRQIWSAINRITCRKKSKSLYPTKIKLSNGNFTEEPDKIANALNDYFVNIGPDLASKLEASENTFESYMSQRIRNSFFLSPTDFAEILTILKKFSSRKSSGPDNIPCKILKLGARALSPILSNLINECFILGVFPKSLKIARVTPIYKDDEPHIPSQWRLISIMPIISKIIEKIVSKRLIKYLKKKQDFNEQSIRVPVWTFHFPCDIEYK